MDTMLIHGIGEGFKPHTRQTLAEALGKAVADVHLHEYEDLLSESWATRILHPPSWLRWARMWDERLEDIVAYFLDFAVKERCINRLAYVLKITQPDHIIAHSLGSVVLFQAMHELYRTHKQPFDIPPRVTIIGSPMAYWIVRFLMGKDARELPESELTVVSGILDPIAKHGRHWNHGGEHLAAPGLGHDILTYLQLVRRTLP